MNPAESYCSNQFKRFRLQPQCLNGFEYGLVVHLKRVQRLSSSHCTFSLDNETLYKQNERTQSLWGFVTARYSTCHCTNRLQFSLIVMRLFHKFVFYSQLSKVYHHYSMECQNNKVTYHSRLSEALRFLPRITTCLPIELIAVFATILA